MTAQFIALHMDGMNPLCRMVPTTEARREAEALALAHPGEIVYVLSTGEAQELAACDPERREYYLVGKTSVCVAAPIPMWEDEEYAPLPPLPGEEQ